MRLLPIFIAAFLFSGAAIAAEQIDLTAPDQAQPGTTTYVVGELHLNWTQGLVSITLVGSNGEIKQVRYGQNDGGRALMIAMNRMDFSSVSLQRRIMNKLISDGHLVGAVSGTPD